MPQSLRPHGCSEVAVPRVGRERATQQILAYAFRPLSQSPFPECSLQPRRPDVDTPTSTPAVVAVAGSASVASATGARLTGCGACSSTQLSTHLFAHLRAHLLAQLGTQALRLTGGSGGLEPTDGFTFARPACFMLPPLTTDPSTARDRGCAPSPCSRRLSRSWEGAVAHSSPFVAFTLATGPIPPRIPVDPLTGSG